jgi:hypothetical protein
VRCNAAGASRVQLERLWFFHHGKKGQSQLRVARNAAAFFGMLGQMVKRAMNVMSKTRWVRGAPNRLANLALSVVSFCLVFLIYQSNYFKTVDEGFFANFQKDSEAIVVAGIVADELNIEKNGWQLGFLNVGMTASSDDVMAAYRIFYDRKNGSELTFLPYRSQVGAHGWFYSALQGLFKFKTVERLQFFPSAAMAILVVLLFFLHRRIHGFLFAIIFSLCLVLSPWVASFARNLYWSPFLWLLPYVFSMIAFSGRSAQVRFLSFNLIFISFFVKCLCGYEYITSLTLLAMSPFIVGPLFANGGGRPDWRGAGAVFSLCIAGFLLAFFIHADMRGNTILDGVMSIYEQDVKRRTYSDPASFDPAFAASLRATPFNVVQRYVFDWTTPLLVGVNGALFPAINLAVLVGLSLQKVRAKKTFARDTYLVLLMSLVPLSWYVMAKGHSYIHMHMNFVLWYLGFVPALIFVGVNSSVLVLRDFYKVLRAQIFSAGTLR